MIEHTVQDQFHATLVNVRGKLLEIFPGPVLRRDFLEVESIVLVVGIGQVDGIEVHDICAEALDMVEARGETAQMASIAA